MGTTSSGRTALAKDAHRVLQLASTRYTQVSDISPAEWVFLLGEASQDRWSALGRFLRSMGLLGTRRCSCCNEELRQPKVIRTGVCRACQEYSSRLPDSFSQEFRDYLKCVVDQRRPVANLASLRKHAFELVHRAAELAESPAQLSQGQREEILQEMPGGTSGFFRHLYESRGWVLPKRSQLGTAMEKRLTKIPPRRRGLIFRYIEARKPTMLHMHNMVKVLSDLNARLLKLEDEGQARDWQDESRAHRKVVTAFTDKLNRSDLAALKSFYEFLPSAWKPRLAEKEKVQILTPPPPIESREERIQLAQAGQLVNPTISAIVLLMERGVRTSQLVNLNIDDLHVEKPRPWVRVKARTRAVEDKIPAGTHTKMALDRKDVPAIRQYLQERGDWPSHRFLVSRLTRYQDKKSCTRTVLQSVLEPLGLKPAELERSAVFAHSVERIFRESGRRSDKDWSKRAALYRTWTFRHLPVFPLSRGDLNVMRKLVPDLPSRKPKTLIAHRVACFEQGAKAGEVSCTEEAWVTRLFGSNQHPANEGKLRKDLRDIEAIASGSFTGCRTERGTRTYSTPYTLQHLLSSPVWVPKGILRLDVRRHSMSYLLLPTLFSLRLANESSVVISPKRLLQKSGLAKRVLAASKHFHMTRLYHELEENFNAWVNLELIQSWEPASTRRAKFDLESRLRFNFSAAYLSCARAVS
jgi:hypothetical protein